MLELFDYQGHSGQRRATAQGLLLYVVGASKSPPPAHPLLPGSPLNVDRLLEGAGLQLGQVRTC